jgi:uncharacterized membrane protein YhdT
MLTQSEQMSVTDIYLRDIRFIYGLWLIALILVVALGVVSKFINLFPGLLVATFIFIYVWVLLVVRMDQLATMIGKPSWLGYASFALPVVGTIWVYSYLINSALEFHKNLTSSLESQ